MSIVVKKVWTAILLWLFASIGACTFLFPLAEPVDPTIALDGSYTPGPDDASWFSDAGSADTTVADREIDATAFDPCGDATLCETFDDLKPKVAIERKGGLGITEVVIDGSAQSAPGYARVLIAAGDAGASRWLRVPKRAGDKPIYG